MKALLAKADGADNGALGRHARGGWTPDGLRGAARRSSRSPPTASKPDPVFDGAPAYVTLPARAMSQAFVEAAISRAAPSMCAATNSAGMPL